MPKDYREYHQRLAARLRSAAEHSTTKAIKARLIADAKEHECMYLGDGILASFGAVTPSVTFAADLCRAIDELATTAERWRLEREERGLPAPRMGLAGAVGDVVFGIVGHPTRLEYTVIGEVVNLVAKLEKHTKSEGVRALTTGCTYALALEQGYTCT